MILNNGPAMTGEYNYNFHYLPTFTLIWSFFFRIFGVFNWVSRLFAIIFSLGSIIVFYKIIHKFYDQKTAVITCAFWLTTPMFIYFGKMPVHEIPLMFFVLLTFWFYLKDNFRLTVISSLLAMLITWPGFFLVPVLILFKPKYWILIPISLSLFGLHLTHDYLVTGDFLGGGLREIFLYRISGVEPVSYLKILTRWAWTYYFLLIPIGLLGFILKPNKISLYFLLYALSYPIIFRDAASRHDYLLIYFWPFITLSAALIIRRYLLAALIILLMLYFRWDYILALQNSSLYKESVTIGEYVKNKTKPGDRVEIISFDKSLPFDGWFAGYYTDRPVTYTNEITNIMPGYKVFYYPLNYN